MQLPIKLNNISPASTQEEIITAKVLMDSTSGTRLLINGVEEDSDATMTGGWTPGTTVTVGSNTTHDKTLNGGVPEIKVQK